MFHFADVKVAVRLTATIKTTLPASSPICLVRVLTGCLAC